MILGYVLLALGVAAFVLSFVIPAKSEDEKAIEFSEDMIKDLVGKEVASAKTQITDIVDETITYAMEKTERSMDRITNEKMMAVNEYSDTVLSEINKNHQEVVFLYDMLNDKHENIKTTVSEVEKTASEVKQAVKDAELTAKETRQQAIEVKEAQEAMEASRVKETKTEEFVPEYSMPNGRLSALDRLRMAKNATEVEFTPLTSSNVENLEIIAEKPAPKKRTTKPKVKEEAVILGDAADISLNRAENDFELVQAGPNLNLGENPVGKTGGRNNNERILELHNQGKSNMAIAKDLGLGIGEVKLVIDLFEGM